MPDRLIRVMDITWKRDPRVVGLFTAEGIGEVRSMANYRAGGWWFLPAWLPALEANDCGPYATKSKAFAAAALLADEQIRTVQGKSDIADECGKEN
jgi:hypothetical protein